MSALARRILKTALILLIPLLIVIGSVRVLATEQYLAFEYGKTSFPRDSYGFTAQQRLELASTNVHYVLAHSPEDTLSKQTINGMPAYNPREVGHMADVRAVFEAILRGWHLGLFTFLLLSILLWQAGETEDIAQAVQAGGILTAGIVLAIALLAIFAWQTWFDLFHRLFFAPGSWLFSYSDTLIRLFPVQFWLDATLTISLFSLAAGLLLALTGWYENIRLGKGAGRQAI